MFKKEMIGDWGFIIGSHRITPEKWKETFPQNLFGRVIFEDKYYVTLRCYRKGGRRHSRALKKYFMKIEEKEL